MVNILLIEDSFDDYNKMYSRLKKNNLIFNLLPGEDIEQDVNYKVLIDDLQEGESGFTSIVSKYTEIDVFIVDASIGKETDRSGIEFIEYLSRNNYRNNNFTYIVVSGHLEDKLVSSLILVPGDNYIDKDLENYPDLVIEILIKKSIIDVNILEESHTGDFEELRIQFIDIIKTQKRINDDNKRHLNSLKKFEKNILNNLILILFYGFILITSLFALGMVIYDFLYNIDFSFSFQKELDETKMLKFIEHIFLFLLPLLVILSFYSYYRSTYYIALRNSPLSDVDHTKGMIGINNSKLLLVSTFLSYCIIKVIEKLFIEDFVNKEQIILSFILIVILMAFIIIQHKKH
ncbi:MAG: hypothetical protein KA270_01860 [Saprospiraceae bacterium]|nr:hypothetical protein [Saprospiraceae bacterium]MBP6565879.1 hypothetical protein [Saprospiraceae bacterium]